MCSVYNPPMPWKQTPPSSAAPAEPAAELWQKLVALAPPRALVVGIGNIANIGNELLAHLRARLPHGVA